MALILRSIYDGYFKLNEFRDIRTQHLPLVSPIAVFMTISGYLVVIKKGQQFMESRKPFNIKGIILLYNMMQVLLNLAVVIYLITIWRKDFNYTCQDVSYENYGIGLQEAYSAYFYLLLKYLDLFDTIFFVLAKKITHISFLHVYHHSFVLFGSWLGVSFVPGGHNIVLGLINCIIHTCMYGYYFMSIANEDVKNWSWLKKTLTQMQMVQFVILIIHFGRAVIFGNCNIHKILLFIGATQSLFMLFLFGDFYQKTYMSKRKQIKK